MTLKKKPSKTNFRRALDTFIDSPDDLFSQNRIPGLEAILRPFAAAMGDILDLPTAFIDFLGSTVGYTLAKDPETIQFFSTLFTDSFDKSTGDKYNPKNLSDEENTFNNILRTGFGLVIPSPKKIQQIAKITNALPLQAIAKVIPSAMKEFFSLIPHSEKLTKAAHTFYEGITSPNTGKIKDTISGMILSGAQEGLHKVLDDESMLQRFLGSVAIPFGGPAVKGLVKKGGYNQIKDSLSPEQIKTFKKLGLNPTLDAVLNQNSAEGEKATQLLSSMAGSPYGGEFSSKVKQFGEDLTSKFDLPRTKGNVSLNSTMENAAKEYINMVKGHFNKTQPLFTNILDKLKEKTHQYEANKSENKIPLTYQDYIEISKAPINEQNALIKEYESGNRFKGEYIELPGKKEIKLADPSDPRIGNTMYVRPEATVAALKDLAARKIPTEAFNTVIEAINNNHGLLPVGILYDVSKTINANFDKSGYGKKYDKSQMSSINKAINSDIESGLAHVDPSGKMTKDFLKYRNDHAKFFSENDPSFTENIKDMHEKGNWKGMHNAISKEIHSLVETPLEGNKGNNEPRATPNISIFNKIKPETSRALIDEMVYKMGHTPGSNKFSPTHFASNAARIDQGALDFLQNKMAEKGVDLGELIKATEHSKALQSFANKSQTATSKQAFRMAENLKPKNWSQYLTELAKKHVLNQMGYADSLEHLVNKPGLESMVDLQSSADTFRKLNRGKLNLAEEEEIEEVKKPAKKTKNENSNEIDWVNDSVEEIEAKQRRKYTPNATEEVSVSKPVPTQESKGTNVWDMSPDEIYEYYRTK